MSKPIVFAIAIVCRSAALLQNQHGVVIKLLSTTKGVRFNLSANGIGCFV